MLGRQKYTKQNIEDRVLEEVSKDMNAHDTFDSVHVGVNLTDPEKKTILISRDLDRSVKAAMNAADAWSDAGKMQKTVSTGITCGLLKKWDWRSSRKPKPKKSFTVMIYTMLKQTDITSLFRKKGNIYGQRNHGGRRHPGYA